MKTIASSKSWGRKNLEHEHLTQSLKFRDCHYGRWLLQGSDSQL